MKHLLAAFATLGLITAVTPALAAPQSIDMSWAIRDMGHMQPFDVHDDTCALSFARSYYNYLQALRNYSQTDATRPVNFEVPTCQPTRTPLSDNVVPGHAGDPVSPVSNPVVLWDDVFTRLCQAVTTDEAGHKVYACQ